MTTDTEHPPEAQPETPQADRVQENSGNSPEPVRPSPLTTWLDIRKRIESQSIFILLALFIGLGGLYATLTPLFEISDELWHYPMVKALADGHGLPVQDPAQVGPWRQEGSQPPLYYAVMALATFWIDTSDMEQVRWINPHTDNGIITRDRNNNILIHTYREQWPWRGTTLAVMLIRFLSVLLGAGVVYFTYRLALEIAPTEKWLALAAAGFVAFTPMFIFISASVNNDTLAIFFASAALWQMARWIRQPQMITLTQTLLMGLILGGAALSKESALGLWPVVGLTLFYAYYFAPFRPRRNQHLAFISRSLVIFSIALLVSFWWYWRNYQLYNDWLGWNQFIAIVGQRPTPATLLQLWGERVGFVQAYWGLFGGVSVPLSNWMYTFLNGIVLVALLGLIIGGINATLNHQLTVTNIAHYILLIQWIVLIFVALLRWTSQTWASQGRLIFPAISAIGVLLAVGWHRLPMYLPKSPIANTQLANVLLLLPLGFMLYVSANTPFKVIAPHYVPPTNLTAERIQSIPHPLQADFGGELSLLGLALPDKDIMPGETLYFALYWQSQIAMDRNWSIFVHLVDEDGIIIAQRDRYPGQGLLATTLLKPGQTFADSYALPIPATAFGDVDAHLEIGLYDLQTGERLRLTSGQEAVSVGKFHLKTLRAAHIPNMVYQNFDNRIELTGYDLETRVVRPGDTLTLTLYWKALAPINTNYSVFAHVRGRGETLWAGADSWPQNGGAPTSAWSIGQTLTDIYPLTLKADTLPGLYDIEVGLYDSVTAQRLRVMNDERLPTDADFVFLSKIRVAP